MFRFSSNVNSQPDGRWVTADLHIHSTYSGGSLTPQEILKIAQIQLLDVVAISDHNEIKGAQEAQAIGSQDLRLPITLASQEISVGNHFHFLMLGTNQQPWVAINRNKLIEKFSEHRRVGGAIILAHPWTMPKTSWSLGFLKEIVSTNLLDAVELFNAAILELPSETLLQAKLFWEEWIVPYNLGVTGGSDFHYYRQGRMLGSGRTYLKVSLSDEQGVIDALRNRRCVAGLFSNRFLDLGWLGVGSNIIFGTEPWFGELKQLLFELKKKLNESWFLKPNLRCYLNRLLETGQYQLVNEMLS